MTEHTPKPLSLRAIIHRDLPLTLSLQLIELVRCARRAKGNYDECGPWSPARAGAVDNRPRRAQNSYFPLCGTPWEAGLEMIDARTSAAVMLKFDTLHAHFPKHLVTDVHYRRP
jgi:hypothetical protein